CRPARRRLPVSRRPALSASEEQPRRGPFPLQYTDQESVMSDPIVIVSAARTPIGAMMGELSGLAGHQLCPVAIRAAVERAGLKPEQVQEVIMGCVLPAGQGQAPARQATLGAGLPKATGATTINKVCGSGMKAAMLAHDLLIAGSQDIVVAGG